MSVARACLQYPQRARLPRQRLGLRDLGNHGGLQAANGDIETTMETASDDPINPSGATTRRTGSSLAGILVLGLVTFGALGYATAAASGDYTAQQAQVGQKVFQRNCVECHGANLQGGAGPTLKGRPFESSLKYSNMSAKRLFNFISKRMPKSDPGSLSEKQYREVLAYLLSENGFPAGDRPLRKDTLGNVKLVPFPKKTANGQ